MTESQKLRKYLFVAAVLFLFPLVSGFSMPSGAGHMPDPSAAPASEPNEGMQVCWAELLPQPQKSGPTQSARNTKRYLCAPNERELNAKILDKFNIIRVESVEEYQHIKAMYREDSRNVPLASYLVGVLYKNANYSGSYMTFTTSNPTTCFGGTQFYKWNFVGNFMNDETTSFGGEGACQGMIFEDADFGGTRLGYYDCVSNVGSAMNDKASSVIWHLTPVYRCI